MGTMRLLVLAKFILLGTTLVLGADDDCTIGVSVVAPELAVPGKTTAVLVNLHGPGSLSPLNVTVTLIPDPPPEDNSQLFETTQEIKGHGILPLNIPSEATGNYLLRTSLNCSAEDTCSLQSSSRIRLVGPVRDVIIRPAKHAYRPGETVSFWVLALNHDLQIANDAIGTVSVKDPAGTKVAFWDQVRLDDGIRFFTLPLSQYARFGRWLLHVQVEMGEFSASVEVSAGAGGGAPDISAAEEHYVELRFGREMRRRYKPGLPFVGKVEAMSTEKSVRVRVKVYDNSTSIYSQDIEISAGEGTFIVPAIMADSNIIALQAELVSVEGKEIESHYVLAREPINKWNSSSECYLLIEGLEHTLQPEQEAHVEILSTCPCERDLHYIITTDGRVTDWAQRRYEDPVPRPTSGSASDICRLHFSFMVKSVMAPVSQLLVYYITPQGEPVSDVISFDVNLLHKQVYVNLQEREWWLPWQTLDLEVVSEPSSLVCLLGGLSRGGSDIKFDPRISEERPSASATGEVDFLEAGVSFFQKQCSEKDLLGPSSISYRQKGSGASPSSRRRPPESLVGGAPFDQLWLWKCFNYTTEMASTGLSISAPEEAGKWSLWALTVSSGGLKFSSPVTVQVFRPLQAEFHLPPSLRVGETLEVDIKIVNNINSCMDVTALLALSEGAQFLSNGLLYVTERLRLGPQGATSLVVRLLVTTSGVKNMTVEVNGYGSPSCGGAKTPQLNATLTGAVIKSATLQVYPEGLVRTDTESAYFCANENILISTADNFKYEWISAPRNRESIVFEIKAGALGAVVPAHVALAETRTTPDKMYKLIIGDSDNTITWIGRGKHEYGVHLTSTRTAGILSADEWRTFWLAWEKGAIAFGEGAIPHNGTLLKWRVDKKIKIQQIGFSSAWGTVAKFRVWNFNDESGFSQVLHLDTPKSLVPGSESGTLLVAGGLALPRVTEGCSDNSLPAALASLSPLLKLKKSGSQVNGSDYVILLKNLPRNIQTILSYRKPDNSFSEHQMVGSHRTTLSILKALLDAQDYISIDPDLIQKAIRWVRLRQEDDGSFRPLPADLKISTDVSNNNLTEKQNFLDHVAELTAETLITFYQYPIENSGEVYAIKKATAYLEAAITKVKGSESLAATTLALVLYNSKLSNFAVQKLRNTSTTEDGEFGWPHFIPKRDAADWLYETEYRKTLKETLIATVEDYKASIYSLWTFCQIGDFKFAESVARYLFYRSHMLDKHPELIYPAVKAFAHFDSLARDQHRALTISLATSGMELTDTLELKPNKPPQNLHLPSLPTKVFVYATGAGCATIQGKINYSTYSVTSETPLLDLWSGIIEEILPDKSSVDEIEGKLPILKIKTCFRWKGDLPSGVLRMDVSLFSGFELSSVTQIIVDRTENMAEMQHGYFANNLWFTFANVSTRCPICVRYVVGSSFIISSLRPAFVRMYPSSRQDLAAETFFHAKRKSNLLRGITDDDLITWFGKNASFDGELNFVNECKLKINSTENPIGEETTSSTTELDFTDLNTSYGEVESSTESQLNTNTPNPQEVRELSVTTYTINVDENSINNLTDKHEDKVIIVPTAIIANESLNTTTESITTTVDNIIIQSTKGTNAFPATVQPVLNNTNKLSTNKSTFLTNLINTNANIKLIKPKLPPTIKELVVDTNVFLPKHVNSRKQNVPDKYIHTPHQEDIDEPATFPPEIKNDRYLPLDKEQRYGILRDNKPNVMYPESKKEILDKRQ